MKIIDLKQNSEEWLEWRRSGKLGASDAPIIAGVGFSTPYQLWRRKLGLEPEQPQNAAMQRGHALEDEARQLFTVVTGLSMPPMIIQHEKYDWMIASMDGVGLRVVDDELKYSALEIKCPGQKDHDTAKMDLVPAKYIPQLQHQLAVTGLDEMYYMSYVSPTDYKILTVKRDDRYIDELIEKELEFMEMLEELTPPPLTDKDYTLRMDNDWEVAAYSYKVCCEKSKRWDQDKEEARKRLIELSGNTNSVGGGVKLTKFAKKSPIVYKDIPELKGLDLEKFRGKLVECWRITEDGPKISDGSDFF